MPFAGLYGSVTRLRNHLFDINYTKSFNFDVMTINVGNLSVGGTGKSPMIEYLIRLLKDQEKVATLSRGYGRKTRGYRCAAAEDDATTLGDEPFQFQLKYGKEVMVNVGEERALAIPEIIQRREDISAVLLDDAFQHRYVRPDLNIMLTPYDAPFFDDFILPAGRLRESRKGAERADIIIVTKCPEQISEQVYRDKIAEYAPDVPVFFTKIGYGAPLPMGSANEAKGKAYAFSAIAKAAPFKAYVDQAFGLLGHQSFRDHHHYHEQDLNTLKADFEKSGAEVLITTEKDAVKLRGSEFDSWRNALPLFYIPITVEFLKDRQTFDEIVKKAIENKKIK